MADKQRLLLDLKSVVECLLSCQVANVWNIYGGLSRLHSVLERILRNGFNLFKQNGEEDIWLFIEGLKWLQPSLATSPTPVCPNSPPPHPHTDKAMIWLHNSLETHSLSEKLNWLISDEQHLAFCYCPEAFLRHRSYAEAALVCLRAVEQNRLTLLTDIHPTLYLPPRSLKAQEKFHRRCSSFPESIERNALIKSREMWPGSVVDGILSETLEMSDGNPPSPAESAGSIVSSQTVKRTEKRSKEDAGPAFKPKLWKSLPSLSEICLEDIAKRRHATEPSSPAKESRRAFTPSVLKINYKSDVPSTKLKRKEKQLKRAAVNISSGESGETVNCVRASRTERRKKKSFIEEDGSSVRPMSTGPSYFPRPAVGQTLTSFLENSLSSGRTPAELERENAHFSVSEAIIAALEQVKCNRWEKLMDEVVEESDEEIQELKQRIRLRRRQIKLEEKKKSGASPALWLNTPSDNTTTDQSFSPRSTDSDPVTDDSLSTEGVDDMEVDQVTPSNLANIDNSGLSLSMASLYSEADLAGGKPSRVNNPPVVPMMTQTSAMPIVHVPHSSSSPSNFSASITSEQDNSAELVALSLLARFSEKQLPKASEVEWLVSEKDVPQQLLPLPSSFSVEDEDLINATPLRGTPEWAPPRPQIIFTPHRPPERKLFLAKQKLRCAGCGMKVAPEYSHKFRYCEYLARYFCTGCHTNQLSVIPGKILSKWDFKKYPVSDFSKNLLDQMASDPLFSVADINPSLYKRVKVMDRLRVLRLQLHYVKDFLLTCKFGKQVSANIEKEPHHLLTELHLYSLQDLIQAKSGELVQRMSQLVVEATRHVAKCDFCQGRGFLCELCSSYDSEPEIIFPWQLSKVTRCPVCFSCQHTACLKRKSCPKCLRLQIRKQTISSKPD